MRTRDENKETAIREKALEMIVKHGFDGLSMQKLARAAEVSPATIYIYYENREHLLRDLYHHVMDAFNREALAGFNPNLSLEEGLWVQWKNRMRFIIDYPFYFQFFEQFRNSPLINHKEVKNLAFKELMQDFVKNAIKRGEMAKMEPEIFWSLAYGSFYSILKFHLQEKTMMNNSFRLTDAKLKTLLKMVVEALKPR
ncbi:MAG: TetR/AcrR family transcriptional regulator [Bacteroidia bacterium]|nr:TetR/AcrR family transcriptional regulator [Bacteroidia bacterium]